jgi:hypothetical protein
MKPANHRSDSEDMQDVPGDINDAGLAGEGESPESVAEELLVHAMLQGRFQDTPETISQRVEAMRLAFDEPPQRLWRHWKAGLSTAAAAVLVIGLLLIFWPPENVQADLGEILEAFDVGDKTYQIEINKDAYQPLAYGRRSGRGRVGRGQPFRVPRPQPAPRHLDGALLYIRDRQYVLEWSTPTGQKIIRGYDGQRSWLIGPWGRSWTGTDPNLLQREIPDDVASLLFLDLRDMLHQVAENYRLSEPTEWTLQDSQARVLCYVAERSSRKARLPRRIELWADAETNQLDHIICTGVSLRGPSQRYTLRIDLIGTDPLPPNWFTQEVHLARCAQPGSRRPVAP